MWVSVNKLHFCGSCILAAHVRPPFRGLLSRSFSGAIMLEGYPNHDEESSGGEASSSHSMPAPQADERPAPIAVLSPAKRAALIAFLHSDGTLHKSRGVWTGQPARASNPRIYGMTIADLARDGLLTVNVVGKSASARLTPRGAWFARTLATQMHADGASSQHAFR
jgi:hypothetical protein